MDKHTDCLRWEYDTCDDRYMYSLMDERKQYQDQSHRVNLQNVNNGKKSFATSGQRK